MKKVLLIVLCIMVIVSLFSGCGPVSSPDTDQTKAPDTDQTKEPDTEPDGEDVAPKVKIAYIMDGPDDWNQAGARAVTAFAEEKGVEIIVMDSQRDIKTQIDLIQSAIAQKVTGIILLPIDNDAVAPTLNRAMEAGITVISYFSFDESIDINDDLIVYDFAQEKYGYDCGLRLGEVLNGEGEVAVIGGTAGAKNVNQRLDGFRKAIAEHYPNITVVQEVFAGWDRAKAMAAMEDLITAHASLDGVFVMNDAMAVGTINAIRAANKTGEIKVVSVDASQIAIEMIKSGELHCSVECSPSKNGLLAIQAIIDLANGKEVERYLLVEGDIIDLSNVEGYIPEF